MPDLNQQAIQSFQTGLYKFSRLTSLRQNEHEVKWIQDENDAIFVLGIVKDKIRETLSMIGKVKYKDTKQFDFVRDVKEEMEELLLGGREQRDQILNQKRNATMYHLVIEPVIDMFQGLSHQEAVINADSIIDSVIAQIEASNVKTTYDDAVVTREIVRREVQEREIARKALAAKRKRGRKETEKDIEDVVAAELDFE